MTINELTRQLVRKRAGYLCEYCHSPEKISTSRFTIDHIQPRSLGGFYWNAYGTKIVGTTTIGRATCERLDLNDERYRGERSIQEARALWVQAGWHPPSEDPRQLE